MTAAACVWGIDPALARLAFAFAPTNGGAIELETLTTRSKATEGERLGLIDRQVRIFARRRAADWPPEVVWVEQPSGRFRNLPLTYAVGVIQAALYETLEVPVWTIPSSTWKCATLGRGSADKEAVARWVRQRGATARCQDEADAYCIAAAGRAMLLAEEWGAKAA